MEASHCPRKVERRTGSLDSFRTTPGDCFARVRIDGKVYNLPLNHRGELQGDGKTILLCVNGHRFEPIERSTHIAVDLVYDANGENPIPGMWAPTPKGRCK